MTTQISVETLEPVIYENISVLTTELLAQLYATEPVRIRQNHHENKSRFVPGKHYFLLEGDALREFKHRVALNYSVKIPRNVRSLILWTGRGAARHAKMLETDQAWEVFEKLEDSYFCQKAENDNAPESKDIIQGDGHSLLIHFDENHQISFTEKVPANAIVATVDKIKWWMEQNGWLVMPREDLRNMTLAQLLVLK